MSARRLDRSVASDSRHYQSPEHNPTIPSLFYPVSEYPPDFFPFQSTKVLELSGCRRRPYKSPVRQAGRPVDSFGRIARAVISLHGLYPVPEHLAGYLERGTDRVPTVDSYVEGQHLALRTRQTHSRDRGSVCRPAQGVIDQQHSLLEGHNSEQRRKWL